MSQSWLYMSCYVGCASLGVLDWFVVNMISCAIVHGILVYVYGRTPHHHGPALQVKGKQQKMEGKINA